jgi:hypothetical protein
VHRGQNTQDFSGSLDQQTLMGMDPAMNQTRKGAKTTPDRTTVRISKHEKKQKRPRNSGLCPDQQALMEGCHENIVW